MVSRKVEKVIEKRKGSLKTNGPHKNVPKDRFILFSETFFASLMKC